jgi:5-methyltetrahydrofolate--homocysteine methyltransferase
MTNQEFLELTQKSVVILDGATGSNFKTAGMPAGVCTELWALEHPEVVIDLQRSYVEAGSQIVYAPTFGANRVTLAMHGLEERLVELNTKLVALSKEAVNGKALVAGDLSTTGKMLEFDISYEKLLNVYKDQIRALVDAGADLLVAETLLSVDEATIILDAAQSICELPVMCTLTLQANGYTLYGGNAIDAVQKLQELGAAAVGLNCSVGPNQLLSIIPNMKEIAKVPIIAKPNAGMPTIDAKGNSHYDMNEKTFGMAMKELVNAGANIVGGCCGTTPKYIKEVVKNVK